MNLLRQTTTIPAPDAGKCLARSVVEALSENPNLEAVTLNPSCQTISVATLGPTDVPSLAEKVTTRIQSAEAIAPEGSCSLLAGKGDCQSCKLPLSELERSRITIRREADRTTFARVTCPTAPTFWKWLDIPWPRVVQRDVEFLEHAEEAEEWRAQLAAAGLCGVLGLGAYFLSPSVFSRLGYALAYVAGSWFTVHEVWERLRKRAIDVHFLMLAVAAGSAFIGAWGEGTTLLFLFSFSGALEHFALGKTQRAIRSLFREAPKVATVLTDEDQERELPVDQLQVGWRLLIRPGSQFPVDGEIVRGQSAADESNLTGEATPVPKAVGEPVMAGTINLWGAVEIQVIRTAGESSLQKIIRLIREAQHQKAPAQRFTDRFSSVYTYLVLVLSFLMFFVWWLGFGLAPFTSSNPGHTAFYRAMTLLVVASPCALVLSIPSAVLAAIAWGARHGILFRGGAAVEKLAGVDVVALDKTGTLTTGELRVQNVESFPPGREAEVARLAYSLERLSTHPLARAVTRYGKQAGLEPVAVEAFESVAGQGLRGRFEGQDCRLGRRDWLVLDAGLAGLTHLPATEPGMSEIWLSSGELAGRVVLRDDIRPQSKRVLEQLKAEGLRAVVLTGDRKAAASFLSHELALEDVRSELKPHEKMRVIREMTAAGSRVAMVGDGVNDAPSLAAAHIGVAMGARGSDSALEQADVVLMHDRLENFLAAFRLSQRARRIIRQNLVISLGTVVVLVTFALLGRIPLTLGVVGHEGSTVIVVMNSLRLLLGSGGASVKSQGDSSTA